jgi:hypothetical protein
VTAAKDHDRTALDLDAVRAELSAYQGVPGVLCLWSTPSKRSYCFDTDPDSIRQAVGLVAQLDADGESSIYHQGTTLRGAVAGHERGRNDSAHTWLRAQFDCDFGKPGYAPDAAAVVAGVRASTLPEPTGWAHSGHGLYPRWEFAPAVPDSPDVRTLIEDMASELRRAFAALGYGLDPHIGKDAARVWRIPGTVNRKYPDAPVLAYAGVGSGEVFTFGQLRETTPRHTAGRLATVHTLPGQARAAKTFTPAQADAWMENYGLRPLRESTEGGRNNQLNTSAMVLGHFVPSFVDEGTARERLGELARGIGLDAMETERTITSGLGDGMRDWQAVPALAGTALATPLKVGDGAQQEQHRPGSSWHPIDLACEWDDDVELEHPTLLKRADGPCLLYPGRTHSIYGESESGKSWIALILIAQTLATDGTALLIDHESDKGPIKARLRALGVTRDQAKRLTYVRPDGPRDAAWLELLEQQFTVAVIDGVTVAISTDGHSSDSQDETARWLDQVPRALETHTGAAVLTIDHVTKARDGRGRFAVGSQHKLNAISGAAYTARVHTPVGRGQVGELVLRITKDRPGGIRPNCGPPGEYGTQEAARVVLDARDPLNIRVDVRVWSAAGDEEHDLPFGAPIESPMSWRDVDTPLPVDIADYKGRGASTILDLARFMRHAADGGVGQALSDAKRELAAVKNDDGSERHNKWAVQRAWGALVELERLRPVNGRGEETGRSVWVKRDGE